MAPTRFSHGEYKEFGMLVSLGAYNFDTIQYPVISCSYIT